MKRTKIFELIIAIAALTWGLSTTAEAKRQRGQEFIPPTHSERMRQLFMSVDPKDENGARTTFQAVNLEIVRLRSSIGQMKAVVLHDSTEENLERLDAYEKSAEALAKVRMHLTYVVTNITLYVAESARAEARGSEDRGKCDGRPGGKCDGPPDQACWTTRREVRGTTSLSIFASVSLVP